ncbi:MAG: hypothetical protein ACOX4G_04495 [Limnochordia bacterium]
MYSLYVDEVNVPLSLLLTRELKASEKIVWMALTMDDQLEESFLFSPSRLGRRTGMSRPTVRRATAKLTTEGWFAPPARRGSGPDRGTEAIPGQGLRACRVSHGY